jgi:uncharacterized membrane protein required for colicin V production
LISFLNLHLVDLVIGAELIAGLYRGYRKGLTTTFFTLLGFVLGGVAGFALCLHYANSVHGVIAKLLTALLVITTGASIGEIIFKKFGEIFHGKILFGPFKFLDSLLGSALGLIRSVVMIYFAGHILLAVPFAWAQHHIPQSHLYQAINNLAPHYSLSAAKINLPTLPSVIQPKSIS